MTGGSSFPATTALAVAALSVLLAGCGGGTARPAGADPARTAVPAGTATTTAPAATRPPDPGGAVAEARTRRDTDRDAGAVGAVGSYPKPTVGRESLVAHARVASVRVYPTATATRHVRTLRHPSPSGAPLVLLVQEQRGDRLRVLLPVRPNGAQGWIRAADVTIYRHDFRIVVATGARRLRVYRGGAVVMDEPVGLGARATPTPGGIFYTKELIRPRDPDGPYGPYAYGLSGYSEVLDEFLGGDGVIGIHGTDDPSGVGRRVSHGCIRMSNASITRLARLLPLGVPVQITA